MSDSCNHKPRHPESMSVGQHDHCESLGEDLFDIVRRGGEQVWLGVHPPFGMTAVPLSKATNFRVSASHHGRYEAVWFFEQGPDALELGQAELAIDEAIRLLGERGILITRIRADRRECTVMQLKRSVARRYKTTARVRNEWTGDGVITTVFEIERGDLARYRDDVWSLAVLTRGERVPQVVEFCRSIRNQDREGRHEILVVGPADPAYEPFRPRYLQGDYRDHLAEISRKKNDVADQARHANLLIVHDRYALDDGFFEGFARYGYDFDFLTVPQRYSCGSPFPAYAALEVERFPALRCIDCRSYDRVWPTHYINGGLMIFKTETLRDIRFNDALFWNQWEDVEVSERFRYCGLPPRVNVCSSATTLGITPVYTKTFVQESASAWYRDARRSRRTEAVGDGIREYGRQLERLLRPLWKRTRGTHEKR
jgi:hypothetical protein